MMCLIRNKLGISIRWVDSEYHIHEDLIGIGMYEVAQTDASTLVQVIIDLDALYL